MTKEEAKYLSDVLKAYSEGKEIEHLITDGVWECICEDPTFTEGPMHYRIKPEPKYRPYANAEEFLKAQKEHGPSIRLGKGNKSYHLPTDIDDCGIKRGGNLWYFTDIIVDCWQDGSPCGMPEDMN